MMIYVCTVKPLVTPPKCSHSLKQDTNSVPHLKSLTLTCVHPNPPKYGHLLIQDSLLWSQWCPYCRGFTIQDSLLWPQGCPYYRGFTVYVRMLGNVECGPLSAHHTNVTCTWLCVFTSCTYICTLCIYTSYACMFSYT